jgi:hypothetical protein
VKRRLADQSPLGAVVTDIRCGTAQKCTSIPKRTAVLRIPNVSAGKIELHDLKYASLAPRELAKLRLQDGDILVVRSNRSADLVGRPAPGAGITANTVTRIENGSDAKQSTIEAIRRALESAGVEFTNGDAPGVRLRKGSIGDPSASIPVEDLNAANDE